MLWVLLLLSLDEPPKYFGMELRPNGLAVTASEIDNVKPRYRIAKINGLSIKTRQQLDSIFSQARGTLDVQFDVPPSLQTRGVRGVKSKINVQIVGVSEKAKFKSSQPKDIVPNWIKLPISVGVEGEVRGAYFKIISIDPGETGAVLVDTKIWTPSQKWSGFVWLTGVSTSRLADGSAFKLNDGATLAVTGRKTYTSVLRGRKTVFVVNVESVSRKVNVPAKQKPILALSDSEQGISEVSVKSASVVGTVASVWLKGHTEKAIVSVTAHVTARDSNGVKVFDEELEIFSLKKHYKRLGNNKLQKVQIPLNVDADGVSVIPTKVQYDDGHDQS